MDLSLFETNSKYPSWRQIFSIKYLCEHNSFAPLRKCYERYYLSQKRRWLWQDHISAQMTTRILSEKKAFICYFVNTTQLLVCVAHLDFAKELTLSSPRSAPLGTIRHYWHPRPGSNRIFQNWTGNMQNSDISAKNTEIKRKTMHARGIYEKVGQVT